MPNTFLGDFYILGLILFTQQPGEMGTVIIHIHFSKWRNWVTVKQAVNFKPSDLKISHLIMVYNHIVDV